MKPFKTLIVAKHAPDLVWKTVRDRLPELIRFIDDIDEVTIGKRKSRPDGSIFLINEWRAKIRIPSMLSSVITKDMLVWTDKAEWREKTHECHWQIETHFRPEIIVCEGTTSYQPAMGGRGTRVAFQGMLEVKRPELLPVPNSLRRVVARGLESFIASLIPKNFHKLINALNRLLEDNSRTA
jgi:hypothetical protein